MRIRTIKPEFWQSETMASIPKDSRLLAIALLNYADDDGYFFASPQVIRGAVFPFDEDSTNVRRGLDELSSIGFIDKGKTASGKDVARVRNFRGHQRIDRPQSSKIAGLEVVWSKFDEDSTNDRRMIDEDSTNVRRGLDDGMEWNGRGMEIEEGMDMEERDAAPPSENEKKERPARFIPPTEDQWVEYCLQTWTDWHEEKIRDAYAYYQSVGWVAGKAKIKDWKAAARTAHGKAQQWGTLQPFGETHAKQSKLQAERPAWVLEKAEGLRESLREAERDLRIQNAQRANGNPCAEPERAQREVNRIKSEIQKLGETP